MMIRWLYRLLAPLCLLAQAAWGAECVFVASIEGSSVFVFDAHTLRLAKEIRVGFGPVAMAAIESKGRVVVANRLDDTMSVIGVDKLEVEASFEAGWLPSDIVVSPDEEWIYIANGVGSPDRVSNTISQVHAETYERFLLGFFFGPGSLAIDHAGTFLYIAGSSHRDISVLNLSDGSVETIGIEGRASHISLTPDGRRLFASGTGFPNTDLTVANLEAGTLDVLNKLPRPRHVAVSPDGRTAYVLSGGRTLVTPFDVETEQTGSGFVFAEALGETLVSRDGRFLYAIPLEAGEICKIDIENRDIIRSATIVKAPGEAILTDCLYDCTGDCDRDGKVAVAEIVAGVKIALGESEDLCDQIDPDGDRVVSINELVLAVSNALEGCLYEARDQRDSVSR